MKKKTKKIINDTIYKYIYKLQHLANFNGEVKKKIIKQVDKEKSMMNWHSYGVGYRKESTIDDDEEKKYMKEVKIPTCKIFKEVAKKRAYGNSISIHNEIKCTTTTITKATSIWRIKKSESFDFDGKTQTEAEFK